MSCRRRATPPPPAARSPPAAAGPHLHRTTAEELQPKLLKLKAAGAASSSQNDFNINDAEMCVQQILDDRL